jgi:hypothetical protein
MVRGDPDHPFTRGAPCVKIDDYERRVYSPDWALYPLKRSGPKASGQFERVTCEGRSASFRITSDSGRIVAGRKSAASYQ